ncbi:MAG: hypothetical protein WA139_03810 [Candidatus Aenigmatarchaeota archaeon]
MALVEGINFLENLEFAKIVLWLLSFALVYGLLSHIGKKGMPESNVARGIIGIVAAFFVLLSVPTQLMTVLSSMSTGLVLLVIGILVFMVFIELAGVKLGKYEVKQGVHVEHQAGQKVFEKHSQFFAVLLIIFAILVFVAAGGLNLLGFNIPLNSSTSMTLLILGVIVLAVYWLINEKQN